MAALLLVLECVAKYLYHNRPHVELVPLVQVCQSLAQWHTVMQAHLDNTVRVVAHHQGAWAADGHTVTFLVRTGHRALRMPRRGHPEPFDVAMLVERGFLPWEVLQTMETAGTYWQPARTERTYPTPRGFVHVEELEAQVVYLGGHRVYWCLHVTCHHPGSPPSETSSETFSDQSDTSEED